MLQQEFASVKILQICTGKKLSLRPETIEKNWKERRKK